MILVLGLDKSCSEGQLEANSSEAALSPTSFPHFLPQD